MDYATLKKAAPGDRAQIIWTIRCQKRAAPEDKAQIYMDQEAPKGGGASNEERWSTYTGKAKS